MPLGESLTWQIVYTLRGVIAMKLVKGRTSAINVACEILDAGGKISCAECAGTFVVLSAAQLHQIWMQRNAGSSS